MANDKACKLTKILRSAAADKQVFPNLDIVGWYATGEDVNEADMHIHRKVMHMSAAFDAT